MASVGRHVKAKPSLQKMDVQAPGVPDIIDEFQLEEFPRFNFSENYYVNQSVDFRFPMEEPSHFSEFVRILTHYGIPLLITIGCVGNTLSFSVFAGTHLKFQSSSVYLAFLNMVDTMFLLFLFISWLWRVDVNLVNRQVFCQAVIYISNVGGFLSVYTVVGFTIERWIIVFHPLKKNVWCTRKRAFLIVLSLALSAMFLYSYTLWSAGLVDINGAPFCLPKPQFYKTFQILTTIDTFITLLLPSVIIIVLNVNIATKIWEFVHKENNNFLVMYPSLDHHGSKCSFYFDKNCEGTNEFSGSVVKKPSRTLASSIVMTNATRLNDTQRVKKPKKRLRIQLRTTRSLLIVSTVFVSLNLPSHAFRIYGVVTELMDPNYIYPKTALLWQQIFQLVYYFNFAVNFFLYSACSKTFRHAFRRLCLRMKRNLSIAKAKAMITCHNRQFK